VVHNKANFARDIKFDLPLNPSGKRRFDPVFDN
jgi:hypothetical protein